MADTRRFDDLKRKISDTAKDLDRKYKIKESFDKGAKAAADGIRKGTEAASVGIEAARKEFDKLDKEYDISAKVKRSTDNVADTVAGGAKAAEAKADDLLGEAEKYYDRFSRATSTTEKTVRAGAAIKSSVEKAREWIKQNPGKAALVGVSVVVGTRVGSAFPGFDAVLLGVGSRGHWFFHSALASYGLRKISERYFDYLKRQEQLIQAGKLSEAEAAGIEFQRNIAKYVGAPLLGAFSVATGATLIAQSLSPGRIVGMPVELLIGGNPILSSIWLFSNGLICIHNGYKFFVMAFADEEAVARIVREAKYLLPA
ncbi:MAG: hypothetical protein HY314_00515 [Acidobacteria bacterium]|nr:hypothetical protein [Acidobacteriota bacterium]